MLLARRSGDLSSMPWKVRGTLVSWANSSVGIQSCPTPPRRPAARPDPTRPWYVRVLDSTSRSRQLSTMFRGGEGTGVFWENRPAGGSSYPVPPRRSAARLPGPISRVACPGFGFEQNYSPRKQRSTVFSKASKKRRFNVSPEARTSEILVKPTEEQNQRLTRGL